MTDHTIGVDISKSHLDVFRLEDGAAQRFENSAAGFRALSKWLGKMPVARSCSSRRGHITRRSRQRLAGLAPITRHSGQWQGKAFIGDGRKPLRDALYMPALVSMLHNPDLKAKYDNMRAAGKPAKVAIVALMRKLIEMANALVKADRKWAPKTA